MLNPQLCSRSGPVAPDWLLLLQMTLGVGAEKFTDPTATLLLQIDCVERDTQQLRWV